MTGAKRLSTGIPQGTTDLGQAVQRWGDRFYQEMHQGALEDMRDSGDFSYVTSPWQSMKIGAAEVVDGFTNNGNPQVSADRDKWFDRASEANKRAWHLMQQKKP